MKTIPDKATVKKAFHKYILKNDHPCIMAQTLFKMENPTLHIYTGLGSRAAAAALLEGLTAFVDEYDVTSNEFASFLAVFPDRTFMTEKEFETRLWQQLQYLHELDTAAWDTSVSADPASPCFSFSIAGTAFYVVGLHPNSSRLSRQSPYSALVFNMHRQFEKLREMGVYHSVRDRIRERDNALQGAINPMLSDFGVKSEARQYSGRQVSHSWKCPFIPSPDKK